MRDEKEGGERQGSLIAGLILIGIGIYFFLWELEIVPGPHKLWPLILVIVGVALIIGHFRTPRPGAGGGEPPGPGPLAGE